MKNQQGIVIGKNNNVKRSVRILRKRIFLLILLGFTCIQGIKGQKIDGFSVNPKFLFYGGVNGTDGIIGGIELNARKNDFIASVDYFKLEEFEIFGSKPTEYYSQIGVMIGKYLGNDLFRFEYEGGLASFWGLRRTNFISTSTTGIWSTDYYESDRFFTVGLVAKIGGKVIPSRFFSLGIDIQANFNLKNTVYMPMVSIEIGKLRDKRRVIVDFSY